MIYFLSRVAVQFPSFYLVMPTFCPSAKVKIEGWKVDISAWANTVNVSFTNTDSMTTKQKGGK